MAIIGLLAAGEPTLALPNITLSLAFLNNGHPPIEEHKYHATDAPLDHNPNQIGKAENNEPETAVLVLDVR